MPASTQQPKSERLTRSFSFERNSVKETERTVEIAFSSEQRFERAFGIEVLDHSQNSVDLRRLNTRAPLLLNHSTDAQIGVVESAKIDGDRKGRAIVRFSRSPLDDESFQDVRDGSGTW